jgi:hypothetical protein
VTANASAQDLRRDGKLSEAREQLRICNDPKCPGIVRTDCTKRLDELEAAQPTVVFDAKDGAGADLSAVKVTVDGKVLTERLGGSALQVNPGEHTFTFEVAGQPPVTRHLVLREGEKDRHEQVVLGAPVSAQPTPSATAALPATPLEVSPGAAQSHGGLGTQKTLGLVVGGVGVAGLVVGGIFGVLTASAISAQKNDCASATNCTNYAQAQSDHSTWSTDGTISTVAFIAGGALVAGGAVLFFTAKPAAEQPAAATALVVAPSVGPGSAGMLVKGAF